MNAYKENVKSFSFTSRMASYVRAIYLGRCAGTRRIYCPFTYLQLFLLPCRWTLGFFIIIIIIIPFFISTLRPLTPLTVEKLKLNLYMKERRTIQLLYFLLIWIYLFFFQCFFAFYLYTILSIKICFMTLTFFPRKYFFFFNLL